MSTSEFIGCARRAFPKVALILLAFAAVVIDDSFYRVVGAGCLVVVSVWTNWVGWLRYVRTGAPIGPIVAPKFSQPGPYSITLVDVGEHQVRVIKVIREVTGRGLIQAKEIADTAPRTIVSGLSAASVSEALTRLEKAGAKVDVVPPLEG